MPEHSIVVAIDGPAAAGKGTLSRALATHLGWHYLDSGSLYRLLAYKAQMVEATSGADIAQLARELTVRFELPADSEQARVWLEDNDVTDAIRTENIGSTAADIAALAVVRTALLARQRAFRREPGLIADGRDMGTVVFPDASLKLFLVADLAERARRRYEQLKVTQSCITMAEVIERMRWRDERDSGRETAALRAAEDALTIDSTGRNAEQIFVQVLAQITSRLPKDASARSAALRVGGRK